MDFSSIYSCVRTCIDGYGIRKNDLKQVIQHEMDGWYDKREVVDIIRFNDLGWFSTIEGESWLVKNRSQRATIAEDLRIVRIFEMMLQRNPYGFPLDQVMYRTSAYKWGVVEVVSEQLGLYVTDGKWNGLKPIDARWCSVELQMPRPGRILRNTLRSLVWMLEDGAIGSLAEYGVICEMEGISPFMADVCRRALDLREDSKTFSWRRVDLEIADGELTGRRYTYGSEGVRK